MLLTWAYAGERLSAFRAIPVVGVARLGAHAGYTPKNWRVE
jgi:hypothetical protein